MIMIIHGSRSVSNYRRLSPVCWPKRWKTVFSPTKSLLSCFLLPSLRMCFFQIISLFTVPPLTCKPDGGWLWFLEDCHPTHPYALRVQERSYSAVTQRHPPQQTTMLVPTPSLLGSEREGRGWRRIWFLFIYSSFSSFDVYFQVDYAVYYGTETTTTEGHQHQHWETCLGLPVVTVHKNRSTTLSPLDPIGL